MDEIEVKQQATTLEQQAQDYQIATNDDYEQGAEFLKRVKGTEKESEKWRQIPRLDGTYFVSTLGNVKRVEHIRVNSRGIPHHIKEKAISQGNDKDGYKQVCLHTSDGRQHQRKVHRLVAEAFIPNPNDYPCVNHKDECKSNNSVSNLEWCTRTYNINYGTTKQRIAKSLARPIAQFSKNGKLIAKFGSAKEAQRELGYADWYIGACCKGKVHQAYGYVWKYI